MAPHSHKLDRSKMSTQGNVYNLKKMYAAVNKEYFENKPQLEITWFGKPRIRPRNKVVFGLYYAPIKLIKIHKILDSVSVPDYVVSYIIYHEILHYICPTKIDEKGHHRSHGKSFKEKEKLFKYYDLAIHWLDHQEHIYFGD